VLSEGGSLWPMYKFGIELLGTVTADLKLTDVSLFQYGKFWLSLYVDVMQHNLSTKHMQGKRNPPSLAHVSYFHLYKIKLVAIHLSYSVHFKLVHSHPTVKENPEMLPIFRLRKEFKTLPMSTRELYRRMKSIIPLQTIVQLYCYNDSYEVNSRNRKDKSKNNVITFTIFNS
jgi:hypothetical protein